MKTAILALSVFTLFVSGAVAAQAPASTEARYTGAPLHDQPDEWLKPEPERVLFRNTKFALRFVGLFTLDPWAWTHGLSAYSSLPNPHMLYRIKQWGRLGCGPALGMDLGGGCAFDLGQGHFVAAGMGYRFFPGP
jgi:hypothetical protein